MKKVHFAPPNQLRMEKEADHDASDSDEFQLRWYSQDEMKHIYLDVLHTVEVMRGMRPRIKGDCSRGIEHMRSEEHALQRRYAIDSLINAVLDEQDRQHEENEAANVAGLARISFAHSSASRHEARDRGRKDAAEASQVSSLSNAITVSERGHQPLASVDSERKTESSPKNESESPVVRRSLVSTPYVAKAVRATGSHNLWKDLSQERVPPVSIAHHPQQRNSLLSQAA